VPLMNRRNRCTVAAYVAVESSLAGRERCRGTVLVAPAEVVAVNDVQSVARLVWTAAD